MKALLRFKFICIATSTTQVALVETEIARREEELQHLRYQLHNTTER
jgi:hypothetical protein